MTAQWRLVARSSRLLPLSSSALCLTVSVAETGAGAEPGATVVAVPGTVTGVGTGAAPGCRVPGRTAFVVRMVTARRTLAGLVAGRNLSKLGLLRLGILLLADTGSMRLDNRPTCIPLLAAAALKLAGLEVVGKLVLQVEVQLVELKIQAAAASMGDAVNAARVVNNQLYGRVWNCGAVTALDRDAVDAVDVVVQGAGTARLAVSFQRQGEHGPGDNKLWVAAAVVAADTGAAGMHRVASAVLGMERLHLGDGEVLYGPTLEVVQWGRM